VSYAELVFVFELSLNSRFLSWASGKFASGVWQRSIWIV
jgi:hypothetical protein